MGSVMQRERINSIRSDWKAFFKSPNLPSNSVRFFFLIIFPLIAYFQDFIQVSYLALADPEIQYILLVPFVAAFFFYKRRKAFSIPRKASLVHDLIGISLCSLALVIHVWGSYSFYPLQLHLISLPILVAGIILLTFGADTLRIVVFPTLLLFFLNPFALVFTDAFGGYLINSVATFAASILRLGFPIEVSYTPFVVLSTYTSAGQRISFELAAACSGIYSLIAMGFFAVVFLYIASGSLAKKAVFASLALFTAYMLNVIRIILLVVLGYFFGEGLAVDFFHMVGGVVILFFGALILIFVSDRILNLSLFQGKPASDCPHCSNYDNICHKCGRILKLPKTRLEWKRLAIIFLFLSIIANLIFQASAVNYNKVANAENLSLDFDPQTGKTAVFSNLTGWSVQFTGREYEAETRLGLSYVGDYILYRDVYDQITSILELSDAQSKFHTWEGCLNYQSFKINIEKRFFTTIYNERNVVVIAETFIADAPEYGLRIVVLSWFDSLNLRTNGTTSIWAAKISLLKYVYNTGNQSDTNRVETATNELLAMGKEIERSWSPYKNSPTSFIVDLYRNKEFFMAFAVGMFIFPIAILQAKSLIIKARFSRKVAELSKEDLNFLRLPNSEKTSSLEEDEKEGNADDGYMTSKIEELKQKGILQERIIMKNGQLHMKWKSFL